MHFPSWSSLTLLFLSAKGTLATVPYLASYSIYDHFGCDIQSHGETIVDKDMAGYCMNFTYPTTSVGLQELQEECSRKLIPT